MDHDRVGPDPGMVADRYRTQHPRTCADIDMATNHGRGTIARTNRNLLKYKAIWPNYAAWVDNNTVGVRKKQPTTDLRAKGYLRSGKQRPDTVPFANEPADKPRKGPTPLTPTLPITNCP